MLGEFIIKNRDEIIRRTRARVATRTWPQPTDEELTLGVPLFLDEFVATLDGGHARNKAIDGDATLHGQRCQHLGLTVAQVVRDYGDICQVVAQLAIDLGVPVSTAEFKALNLCLDDAIAGAVTEYGRVRERSIADDEVQRLGFLAHELRNLLHTARLSYDILKTGKVAIGGSTGAVLDRSLAGLQLLVDRTVARVRLDAGIQHGERIELSRFLEEIETAALLGASDRPVSLVVEHGNSEVAVEADRQLLESAVFNLVQNALKFTRAGGRVRLSTRASADRVVIEVEDGCGGLPPETIDQLFAAFRRKGRDTEGLGLGLAISRRAIEAIGGTLHARNHADIGCVFSIELPRLLASARAAAN
jgi:signal transduction histidine kinase